MNTPRLAINICLVVGLIPIQSALADDSALRAKVSFYFAAHEDDWQLFMNPTAFNDVTGGAAKTVFVHVTAGDAGAGTGRRGRKYPYYLARENGAENAIRFMAEADTAPVQKAETRIPFNRHQIYRMSYRDAVGYFLRVPDGNASGSGYPQTGYQSLKHLADGVNDTLAAIDGSTVYHSWRDLVATVQAILTYERGHAPLIQINVADPDPRFNPDDHSDHLTTAKAALEAAEGLSCVRRAYYVDYASARLPENLDPQQRDRESSVFGVTLAGILALDHGTSWQHYDQSFVGRNYFRIEEAEHCAAGQTEVAAAQR